MIIESIIISILAYFIGAIISLFVAFLIKGVFMGIQLNARKNNANTTGWKGMTLKSKPAGH